MTHLLCQGFRTTEYQHFKELAGSRETKTSRLPHQQPQVLLVRWFKNYNHNKIPISRVFSHQRAENQQN